MKRRVRELWSHYTTWRDRGGFLEEVGRLTSDRNLALQIILTVPVLHRGRLGILSLMLW